MKRGNLKQKTIFPFAFIVLFASLLVSPLLAQSDEATEEASPTISEEIQEKVEDRLERVAEEQTEEKRAFVGEITDINTTLEIFTDEGEKYLQLEKEAEIIGLDKKPIEAENLEIGQFVIALGYTSDNETLKTLRLMVTEEPEPSALVVVFGKITDQSEEGEKILTLKHLKKDEVYEIEVTTKTTMSQKIDDEIEKIDFEEIEPGDLIIAIGTPDEENENLITAKTIRLFPAEATETSLETEGEEKIEEEAATPSAKSTSSAEE